jgi:hypothetical protein
MQTLMAVTISAVLAEIRNDAARRFAGMPPSKRKMNRIGKLASTNWPISSSRATVLPRTISTLERSVVKRYSIVRRSRSVAIVPTAIAGATNRMPAIWIQLKV